MFIVFEGIDGSGKTTLSNRVAAQVREAGLTVEHVREGGKFASRVTQAVRELGRDARNMDMTPLAELLMFVMRDAQLLEEATLPAIARADLVLADRYLYTAEVLAVHGRGLAAAEVAPVVRAGARGVWPELVILVDVDPHVARARRRVAKINVPDPRPSSRKGLWGVGLQHRLRDGYLELAARDPERWIVLDNTDADLGQVTEQLVAIVTAAVKQGPAAARALAPPVSPRPPARATTPAAALAAFLAWVDRRAVREPDLAAYFLAGLSGPAFDERRRALLPRAPRVIASGLRGLGDAESWRLREALVEQAPDLIAKSVGGLVVGDTDAAWALRTRLAPIVPAAVAASLDGRDDPRAWALREAVQRDAFDDVVESTKRLPGARAWSLRDAWLAGRGGEPALADFVTAVIACASISGLDDERAWDLRKAAREAAPVAALDSIAGLVSERAWKWRDKAVLRAPKIVMRTIDGLDDARAWALRAAVADRCKEAIDSMSGLDGPAAWALRDRCADLWPSTVAKSLGPLVDTPRGQQLLAFLLERHGDNISLLKHAAAIAAR